MRLDGLWACGTPQVGYIAKLGHVAPVCKEFAIDRNSETGLSGASLCYHVHREGMNMDGVAIETKAKISDAEMARRRKIVRQADAHNRIEGIFREPETDEIVEAFVGGDIEATDLVRLFKSQPAAR